MPDYLFPLIERREIAKGTLHVRFDARGSGFVFRAGQYADFTLIDPPETDAEGNIRTFSIASSPSEKDYISTAFRLRPTAFKRSIAALPLGTKVKVRGPMGSFTLHKDASKRAVFIAGGIGITPIRSIIISAREENLPHRMILFYSNRKAEEAAFIDELRAMEGDKFHMVATATGEGLAPLEASPESSIGTAGPQKRDGLLTGRIGEAMLRRHLGDLSASVYYIAGSPEMVGDMRALLVGMGISEDDIKTEDFAGY